MRILRTLLVLLILGILLLVFVLPVSGQTESLTVAINENRPLAYLDENGLPAGFYVDLLNYIAEKESWTLEYIELPRAEILKLADKGEIDLIATIGYHELFIDRYVFTEEKLLNNWGVVYVQDGSNIESILELEGKSVAILEASTHGEAFKKLIDDFEIDCAIVEVGNFSDVANLLEQGEVDAGLLNRMIGLSFEPIYEIQGTSIIFNPIDVRIAASQMAPPFVIERIDAHLADIKGEKDSYYYQSFSKWFGPPENIPLSRWIIWILSLGAALLVVLIAISLMLRFQVKERTAALVAQNKALASEVEEHNKTLAILKESEGRYRGVVEDNPILICSFTTEYEITYANTAYCKYYGKELDELLGLNFLALVPKSDQKMVITNISKLTVESPSRAHEHRAINYSGEARWQQWTNRAIFDDQGKRVAFQSIGEDITERKQAEDALRKSARELTALNAVSSQVNRFISIEEVALAAVKGVLRATEASVAFLSVMEGGALVPVEIAYSKPEKALDETLIDKASSCISEMTLRERRPTYSKNLYDDIRCTARECKQAGFRSSAALPLFWDDEIFAVLGVGTDTALDFETQSDFLETLASEVANGMKNAKLFAEIQRELSERKKIEKALIESEEQFRTLFESSPVGIGVADRDGKLFLFNDAILQPGGYSPEDIQAVGSIAALYVSNDQRAEALKLFRKQGFLKDFEVQFKRKDGSAYDAALSLVPVSFGGNPCVQAIVEDRTERKQAEEANKESQRRLATLMSNLPGMAYRCKNDPEWTMEFVSDGCFALTGYLPDDFVNNSKTSFAAIIHREDRVMVWDTIQDALKRTEAFQLTYRIENADGTEKWVWEQGQGVFWEKGEVLVIEGFITDITERVHAEEQLKLQSLALESAANAVLITDAKGIIQWSNPAFSLLTGYSFEEVRGKNPKIVKSGQHDKAFYKKMWKTISGGDVWRGEIINRRKDGELYTEEMTIAPLISGEGKISNFIAIKQDITVRVETEQALSKYAAQLKTLNTVTAALSTSLNLDGVLELILDQIRQVLPLDSGAIFLAEGDNLRVVFDIGITPSLRGQLFPAGNELFDEVKHTGEPLILNNIRKDPRFANWADFKMMESWMGIPLIVRGDLIGFMTLDNNKPNAFHLEDIPIVSAFGSQSAQAIDNARQFRTAQRRLKRLDALHKIDHAISNSMDLRVTLSVLLDHLLAQLKVDAAAVLLYKNNLQSLTFAQSQGFRTATLRHTNLQLGQGRAGKAALERKDVFVADLSQAEISLLDAPKFKEEGFVAYYGVPLVAKGSLVGVLEIFHRSPLEKDGEWDDYLHSLAGQAAIAIDNISLFNNLQKSTLRLMQAHDATIEGWAQALELRDMETEGHSRRVVDITIGLARSLGIIGDELGHIRRGALLHDIGKMGVPDAILQKPGKLTPDEWKTMELHPVYAYEWLSSIEYLRPALDIPYCHHEKWDGTGYPRGLQGKQIPLAARVFAIVDVWDALRSDRPYRKAWSREKTLAYIQEQSGMHFDPRIVTAFLQYLEEKEGNR